MIRVYSEKELKQRFGETASAEIIEKAKEQGIVIFEEDRSGSISDQMISEMNNEIDSIFGRKG